MAKPLDKLAAEIRNLPDKEKLQLVDAILEELKTRQLDVNVRSVGCIGICIKEPLVEIQQAGGSHVLYANVLPDMVPRLIEQHLIRGEPVRQWIACRISD